MSKPRNLLEERAARAAQAEAARRAATAPEPAPAEHTLDVGRMLTLLGIKEYELQYLRDQLAATTNQLEQVTQIAQEQKLLAEELMAKREEEAAAS